MQHNCLDRWNEMQLLSECYRDLGLQKFADRLLERKIKDSRINDYRNILVSIAKQRKNTDVLDRLYFAGFIYG